MSKAKEKQAMTTQTPAKTPFTNSEEARNHAEILDRFQIIDEMQSQIADDLELLERIGRDPDFDQGALLHTIDSVSFVLRIRLMDLSEQCEICYQAVRKGWGYDN